MSEIPGKKQDNKESGGEFPKIQPPTEAEILKAKLDHAMEDPNIQKLVKDGHGVFINSDTGDVTLIDDKD